MKLLHKEQLALIPFFLGVAIGVAEATGDVHVIGEMRRMFTAHDIGANVDIAPINVAPHVYGLAPLNGLKGEVTILDGQVYVSRVEGSKCVVDVEPGANAIFLVYATVPAWRSSSIPATVSTEAELATFVERQMPGQSRSAFLVRGNAKTAKHHVQNFQGNAEGLTHESHEQSKVFYDVADTPVELVGFFSNREQDAGSFVHRGQTTHIHLISADRKSMGHLESLQLAPGATLLLPAQQRK